MLKMISWTINVNRNYFSRCCCFFKRKKKKSTRQKWLEAVQCSPEREAVTLLRATSHSNSRDSVVNQSQDYVQASSQHTLRFPSASVLTTTPTNTPTLPLWKLQQQKNKKKILKKIQKKNSQKKRDQNVAFVSSFFRESSCLHSVYSKKNKYII